MKEDLIRNDGESMRRLGELIAHTNDIVITCHVAPDGDAIGSSLALWEVLRSMGKKVTVVTPDMWPRTLAFLPGIHNIVVATQKHDTAMRLIGEAQLIVCLDFNALMRIDQLSEAVRDADCPKVLIDHHLYPESFADVMISHPEASSTCYLLFNILEAMGLGERVNTAAAECIYTGMMTDTGALTYNCNDPGVYMAVARLMERGIDKDRIYKLVFDTNSESRLRLCGYAIAEKMEIFREQRAALITLTRDELDRFGYVKGDTESLVNRPLSMPDIVCSLFLREDKPGFVKISARSKGSYPANRLCEEFFGGGGHRNAAGGEFYGSTDEARRAAIDALEQMAKKHLNEQPSSK